MEYGTPFRGFSAQIFPSYVSMIERRPRIQTRALFLSRVESTENFVELVLRDTGPGMMYHTTTVETLSGTVRIVTLRAPKAVSAIASIAFATRFNMTCCRHAYPLSSGSIECYVSSAKELDHDRHDAGRSVA